MKADPTKKGGVGKKIVVIEKRPSSSWGKSQKSSSKLVDEGVKRNGPMEGQVADRKRGGAMGKNARTGKRQRGGNRGGKEKEKSLQNLDKIRSNEKRRKK